MKKREVTIRLKAKDLALLDELCREMNSKPKTVITRALKSLRTARNNETLMVWHKAPDDDLLERRRQANDKFLGQGLLAKPED